MAKKKVTHQENQAENNVKKPQQEQQPKAATMADVNEASSEKLESLKSLNKMLLTEAVGRRQQVESLMQAKGSLESEVTRANSEKELFQSELTQMSDEAVRLEMERKVVFEFVGVQVGQQAEAVERERDGFKSEKVEIEKKMKCLEEEMNQILSEKSEIEKAKNEKDGEIVVLNEKLNGFVNEIGEERNVSEGVSRERDELRVNLDVITKELKGLQVKLIEAENREKGVKDEVEELAIKYKGVVEEKQEKERRIELMMTEKDAIEKRLIEANRVIEELKGKIEMIGKEKEGIEEERNVEKIKRSELESAVDEMNLIVSSLKEEEERLRLNVAALEKKNVEGVEREKEMGREIDGLVEEKNEREKKFEILVVEKCVVEKDLDDTLKELNEQKMKTEGLIHEKNKLVEDKERKESEILELQTKVEELQDEIQELGSSYKVQMEKLNNLESKFDSQNGALKRVTAERDAARKACDDEKLNGTALKDEIEEMEKSIEKYLKLVEEMKAEKINLTEEKELLESRCEILKKEKSSTENTLGKIQKEFDALRSKVEMENSKSGRILNLLKGTAELVRSSDENGDTVSGEKETNGEETDEPFVANLELIKNAFKSKESKVEDMTRQLEFLQNSVTEAHKKKSVWRFMSATTLFAAISLAYIARGH